MPTNIPPTSERRAIRWRAPVGRILYLRFLVLPVARLLVFVIRHSAPRGRLVGMLGVIYRWLAPR